MEVTVRRFPIESGGVCRILMIGNSFCQNFLHELYGMAAAAGVACRITSVIAGACTLEKHWNWCRDGEHHYTVITLDADGYRTAEGLGLDDALAMADWDVISYQDGEYYYRLNGLEAARAHMEPNLENLVNYVRGRFPRAIHLFHQVWAYQVGYDRPEKSPFKVPDREAQAIMHRDLRAMALEACEAHDLGLIPGGDAWALARADVRVGDVLCMPDCEHESAAGGGQYLNACVWFETIFGLSCMESPFCPDYALAEEKMTALREAAHRAVAEALGAG